MTAAPETVAIVGLIGHPVGHSLSAAMHNTEFARQNINARYELWDTPPDTLTQRVQQLRDNPDVRGFNITVPWKRDIIPLLDTVAPAARVIGAVNTVVRDTNGHLTGHNTDADGWHADVREHFGDTILDANARILMLGAGGVARAVAAACLQVGVARLTVACRNRQSGLTLLDEMQQMTRLWNTSSELALSDISAIEPNILRNTTLIVNCTSLGMQGHSEGQSPLGDGPKLCAHHCVYDTVYRPAQTRLLEQAHQAHCRAYSNGLGMLAWQGALAARLWLDFEPDAAAMRQTLLRF